MAFAITEQVQRHLTDDTLVWLTTVSPSGRPTPRLVWFMWVGDGCLIYSQPDAAKLRHIADNPRVTLNFNSDTLGGDAVVLAGLTDPAVRGNASATGSPVPVASSLHGCERV